MSSAFETTPAMSEQYSTWKIMAVCMLAAFMYGFDTHSLSFIVPYMAKDIGIGPAEIGRIFGAGVAGAFIGTLVGGLLADRFGGRSTLIGSLAITGIFTIASGFSETALTIGLMRLVAGIGLGASMVVKYSIISQFTPPDRSSALMVALGMGAFLGATLGGFLGEPIAIAYGWPTVLIIGGTAALVAILPIYLVIPNAAAEISAGGAKQRFTWKLFADLLSGNRAGVALVFWLTILLTWSIVHFLVNFMPTLLHSEGVPTSRAALLQVGAMFGALALSLVVSRLGVFRACAGALAIGAVALFLISSHMSSGVLLLSLLFVVGGCLIGGLTCTAPLAVQIFPDHVRSTAIGVTLSVGKIGGILGPVVGGMVLAGGIGPSDILLMLSLCLVLSAAAIILANRFHNSTTPKGQPAV